jgi:ADP-heptose:LPS heptosyltransferase
MKSTTDPGPEYPVPLAPMVGGYLVRKKSVAAGLLTIDAGCRLLAASRSRGTSSDSLNIQSILISQCGHLGDLIMTLPVLRWIRCNRPSIKIGLVVGSWAKPMINGISELYDACYFANHFMLDRSDSSLKTKLARHRASWTTAAAEIKRDRYDAAIECYAFLQNSIPLLYACGIPLRVGFTCGGFGALLTHRLRWRHESRSFIDYPRDLLRTVFTDTSLNEPLRPYYPPPAKTNKVPSSPYLLVQLGAGNAIKEWPENRWIELIRDLKNQRTTIVLAGAGSRERERAARVQEAVGGVVDLCDRLSWDEFVALVAKAAHVVCLDSSTSHLAAAFQIPSTILMPGINDPAQFGPVNSRARILTFPTPCAPCFRSRGCNHMACIRQVLVPEVRAAILGGPDLAV